MLPTSQEPLEPAAPQGARQSHRGLGEVLGVHRAKEMGDAISWGKSRQMFQLNGVHLGPAYCSAVGVVPLLFPVVPFK